MKIKSRHELALIETYRPGKPISDVKRELGLTKVIKLASNENPVGFSPKVKEAITKSMEEVNLYPDGNATLLKEAIAKKWDVPVNMVLTTSGLDEMLDLIAKTFINKGDKVLMADITFPRYFATSQMMGADIKYIPLKDLTYDIEGFISAITPDVKLVWLCNPNNPTGTIFGERELLELLERIPETCLVVYDEAYAEFVTAAEYPKNSVSLVKKYENLIALRTLSKAYGLAGLRIGYTIGHPEILNEVNKVRNAFNVSLIAQAAGIAALQDDAFLKEAVKNNSECKEYIYKEFDALGIQYAKTQANFIIFNSKMDSEEIFRKLLSKGVIIRPVGGFNPNTWLRVTIGTMEENEMFIKALKEVYQ